MVSHSNFSIHLQLKSSTPRGESWEGTALVTLESVVDAAFSRALALCSLELIRGCPWGVSFVSAIYDALDMDLVPGLLVAGDLEPIRSGGMWDMSFMSAIYDALEVDLVPGLLVAGDLEPIRSRGMSSKAAICPALRVNLALGLLVSGGLVLADGWLKDPTMGDSLDLLAFGIFSIALVTVNSPHCLTILGFLWKNLPTAV